MYYVDHSGLIHSIREGAALLVGRLGDLLREDGLGISETIILAESPKTNLEQVKSICSSEDVRLALTKYSSLNERLIEEAKHLVQIGRQNALEIWDSAFTQCLGQHHTIDWDDAWDGAETFFVSYTDDDGEWASNYKKWLLSEDTKTDEDDFETFLQLTGNEQKYERHVRRILRVGLLRSAMEQLGISEPTAWLFRLLDEQVAKGVIPYVVYEHFDYILDEPA